MKRLFFLIVAIMTTTINRANGGFLFVTFHNEKSPLSEQIYFAISQDGRNWEALNHDRPALVSDVGEKAVRDAYLLRSRDGRKFYLLATDLSVFHNHDWTRNTNAGSKSIVIWDSSDLVHWSKARLVQVAPDDAGCAWAPEAIWDDETRDYLVFWASKTRFDNFGKQRIWACHTRDFVTFGKPFIYIEKPHHVIDTDIIRAEGEYYRFNKDDEYKAISMEVSDKLSGPWRAISDFSLAHLTGYEAPECFQLAPAAGGKPATWCLLIDHYSKGSGYEAFVTSDLAGGQFRAAADFKFPYPFRHGSVLDISAEELARLKAAFPPGSPISEEEEGKSGGWRAGES